MRLAAVKSAHDVLLQPVGFGGVFRLDHSPGESAQILRAEQAVFPGTAGEFDDPALFVARQPFYFFDDFNRCHASKLPVWAFPGNPFSCNWPGGLRTSAPDTETTARLANDG